MQSEVLAITTTADSSTVVEVDGPTVVTASSSAATVDTSTTDQDIELLTFSQEKIKFDYPETSFRFLEELQVEIGNISGITLKQTIYEKLIRGQYITADISLGRLRLREKYVNKLGKVVRRCTSGVDINLFSNKVLLTNVYLCRDFSLTLFPSLFYSSIL